MALIESPARDASSTFALLIVRPGHRPRHVFDYQGEVTVGRSRLCDIVLEDPIVSRRHVAIRRAGNRFVIHDLGSRNGTLVNDSPVQDDEAVVAGPAALIQVGPYLILAAALTHRYGHASGQPAAGRAGDALPRPAAEG
jgi:pSer/pThr/pTyr-binding forkhead associated (FHA) protein